MIVTNAARFLGFPQDDAKWSEAQWKALLEFLVQDNILRWREIASLTLGHLNPSQVGTSIASKKSFQRHYPSRQCWAAVREWHFDQSGNCSDCGTRLELQADHAIPKELIAKVAEFVRESTDPLEPPDRKRLSEAVEVRLRDTLKAHGVLDQSTDVLRRAIASDLAQMLLNGDSNSRWKDAADRLDNMLLRCRRCNVIRRPSHARGGETFLTAESALMWLLLVKCPASYEEFQTMCRQYGMTMANIRFEEAWAMARWLNRFDMYHIDRTSKYPP